MSRPGGVRRAAGAAVLGVAVSATAWFLGVQAPFALAWGLLGAVCVLLFAALGAVRTVEWTHEDPPAPQGRNDEVARLAWAIDRRRGHLGTQPTRRLHALARRRLESLGIDPDDPAQAPAVEQELGPAVVALLAGDELSLGGAEQALARIEEAQARHAPAAGGSDAHGATAPRPHGRTPRTHTQEESR